MRTITDLKQRQALPLDAKILMSQNRIREWYNFYNGDVYISFSGGKDSTVLANLVHDLYPSVPLVFVNTGLEYPENQMLAKKMGAIFVRPKMLFSEVISKYGYPIIGKEVGQAIYWARRLTGKEAIRRRNDLLGKRDCDVVREGIVASPEFNKTRWLELSQETNFLISSHCCYVMKKTPLHGYEKETGNKPYIATLAVESRLRRKSWLKYGCNAFSDLRPMSKPLSFWTEQDILEYIKTNNIEISSVYGQILEISHRKYCEYKCSGCQRTGCIFCGFGVHLESGETRFQRLAKTHPRQYEYCLNGGQWVDNPNYDSAAPVYSGEWKNWNPRKIWVPSKEGLGMRKVFDDCNQIYGKDFIRYE